MSFKPTSIFLAVILLLSALSFNALAQGTMSPVTGMVADDTGAAVGEQL